MANVSQAILELNTELGWVLRGEPTNEDEFKSMFSVVVGADEHGSSITSSDSADWGGLTWESISTKLDELNAAEPLKLLREERDRRIAETDWWVLSDREPTQEQLDYRQALRNITDTYQSLDTVVWPEKP